MALSPIRAILRRGASVGILLLGACARPRPGGNAPAPEEGGPLPLARVFVLEAAGIMPEDTVVTIPAGARRVVVLRRSAPDFGLFARLEFGDSALEAPPGNGTARVTLRPVPGEYGLDLEVAGKIRAGATVVFSYGSHFLAPAGARERYGSELVFEQALSVARVENNEAVFLPTSRPGTDMVEAAITGPGRYVVGARKQD
jgi:hypothetical protein